ncbi:MAG: PleD family two-component system response regulator [Candidatus Methylomirabilales bacterium]
MSRVLVIEDDPRHRELMTALLSGAQYEVHVAENGRLGLSVATEDPPDLVLLDLYLPDMDGYEVCRRLRQRARTQRTPIVIITASDDPALNRRAYAAGAQACIPKPFRHEALLATVETVLAGVVREPEARSAR